MRKKCGKAGAGYLSRTSFPEGSTQATRHPCLRWLRTASSSPTTACSFAADRSRPLASLMSLSSAAISSSGAGSPANISMRSLRGSIPKVRATDLSVSRATSSLVTPPSSRIVSCGRAFRYSLSICSMYGLK